MLQYIYDTADYQELMAGLAHLLNTPIKDNCLELPKDFAEGTFCSYKLPNGLQVNLVDIEIKQPFTLYRKECQEEFYTLRYDEYWFAEPLKLQLGGNRLQEEGSAIALAHLTSSLTDFKLQAKAGTRFRGVNILFDKEWISRFLKLDNSADVLTEYFNLRSRELNMETINAEDRKLIIELFEADRRSPLFLMIIQNRILLLIEGFFNRLYQKTRSGYKKFSIRRSDMDALNKVRWVLAERLGKDAPTLVELVQITGLTQTRLKHLFKQVYGMPVYSYLLHLRMHEARELLKSGKSTQEVSEHFGYEKKSNFLAAYQKVFGKEPEE